MDKVASQFGMRRLTEAGVGELAKYQKDYRSVLSPKTVRSFYLIVDTPAREDSYKPEGSIAVDTSGYVLDAHKILKTAKQALAERFGYNRVFVRSYHPFNF